jgi:hypothetical protein
MKLTTLAAFVSCAVLLAGCQTTSGPSAAALSRLETAGFVTSPAFVNLTFSDTTVNRIMICQSATCVPPTRLVHVTGPDRSSGLGGTLEDAIRAGRNRQVLDSIRKQLTARGTLTVRSVRPYVQAGQARVRIEGRYIALASRGDFLIGDGVVQGNTVSVVAVISNKRNVADWFLGVALDRD